MDIIIFGAGGAGQNFIKRNTEHKIIAITDNDASLWGSEVLGIPVIDPRKLNNKVFDKIYITSSWPDSIYSQLVNDLKLPESKIVVTPKADIKISEKPFLHPPTLAIAREAVIAINQFLTSHKVNVYLDFGTLLGLIRDGDLIPWDDDVDFAINEEDFFKASELMKHFLPCAPKYEGMEWVVSVINQAGEDISISIELKALDMNTFKEFSIGLAKRVHRDGNSELASLSGMLYAPSMHFIGHETMEFFGHTFCIPNKPHDYLAFVYGDWKTPLEGMSFQDYSNRKVITDLDLNTIRSSKKLLAK